MFLFLCGERSYALSALFERLPEAERDILHDVDGAASGRQQRRQRQRVTQQPARHVAVPAPNTEPRPNIQAACRLVGCQGLQLKGNLNSCRPSKVF